jgi:tRNA A37 threonylcarbamoyladenosine dehydratase
LSEENSANLSRRFAGLDRLMGIDAADRVRNAHIAVVGVGGVGSWAAEALARSGVGRITLIDMDHVAESNLNRQVQAVNNTIGMAKVLAMKERIASINPTCVVNCIEDFAGPSNWPQLLGADTTAVIDACDQAVAKVSMADWSRRSHALFVSVGAAGGKRLGHLVDILDLSAVTHDPLLARVRNRLRKEFNAPRQGRRMGVMCVSSPEPVKPSFDPSATSKDHGLNCHGYGSSVSVTATFGLCAAGWIMEKISSR